MKQNQQAPPTKEGAYIKHHGVYWEYDLKGVPGETEQSKFAEI